MDISNYAMIIDALMLLLLAAVILFAARLSLHLKAFRDSRADMEALLQDLSQNIVRAEMAIDGLRQAAREGGRDLQERINEAKGLSSELQIMSESGGNIASRLEKAAHRKARPASSPGPVDFGREEMRPARKAEPVQAPTSPAPGGFAIRDTEFLRDDDEEGFAEDEDEWSGTENLQSRAEKELYDALRRKGRKTDAGGVS